MQQKQNVSSTSTFKLTYLFPPIIGLLGVGYMLLISYLLKVGDLQAFALTSYEAINAILTIQVFVLPISFLVLGIMFLYNRKHFREFLRIGEINAPTEPLKILGIKESDTWKKVGFSFVLILGLGTAIFMTIAVLQTGGKVNAQFFALLPLALIFSTTNAWSEEVFTRFTVVAGLEGKVKPVHKYWISAAIFGIPHYFGTPGGIIGAIMAGFMGWLLAKAVQETKGMFWAWFIHFVQDVIIFSANLMMIVT